MHKTALCDIYGVEYPIIQGGMAWLATAELSAAVSEAGDPGVIYTGNTPPESVEQQIIRSREMTSKPSDVNVMRMSPLATNVMGILLRHKVSIVPTGAVNPGICVPRFKEAGRKVMPVVSSGALARLLEHIGVDAIAAEGIEDDTEMGWLLTGQIKELIKENKSVNQNIHDIIAEANTIMAGLSAIPQGVS